MGTNPTARLVPKRARVRAVARATIWLRYGPPEDDEDGRASSASSDGADAGGAVVAVDAAAAAGSASGGGGGGGGPVPPGTQLRPSVWSASKFEVTLDSFRCSHLRASVARSVLGIVKARVVFVRRGARTDLAFRTTARATARATGQILMRQSSRTILIFGGI